MTWVKVCGLSTEQDVAVATAAGADAVGFVIAGQSPRRVSVDVARDLASGSTITTVLVTVDIEPARLLEYASHAGVTGVQPHGIHALDAARAAARSGLFVLLPVPMRETFEVPAAEEKITRLFDSFRADQHGGTGAVFDWRRLKGVEPPFVVAGGLDPMNVGDAIRAVRPWGVDASSGLEAAAGVKDHGKVAAFVREAKSA